MTNECNKEICFRQDVGLGEEIDLSEEAGEGGEQEEKADCPDGSGRT